MPVRGSKPTGQPTRRRNKPVHEWVEVPDAPFTGGPKLPKTQPGQPTWPTATRVWWKAISQMPHCILWAESDWLFALDTALLSAHFHRGGIATSAELRHREKIMGTTLDARRDLRIRYVPEAPEDERVGVSSIEGYRTRLAEG